MIKILRLFVLYHEYFIKTKLYNKFIELEIL